MSVQAEVNERLAAMTEAGTAVWLDQIRRTLIEDGELERLVAEDSLRGVTSNPAIFEKAILGSDDYDETLVESAREGLSAEEMFDRIAVYDVQAACDVLRPVWESLEGKDGFVSLEVAPRLSHDTEGTVEAAQHYWDIVDRPNLMVKIPGTDAGIPAIEEMISRGVNVNVTLLFSVEAYGTAQDAFIRGLERRQEAGGSVDVHSVASFFVSRVDSEIDKRLEKAGRTDLQGTAALANARLAYQRFKEVFYGDRFAALKAAGAPVQRPLWASTGVKNPNYSETMYVDGLIAPDTVNTMPMATLLASAEHLEVSGATADEDPEVTKRTLDALAEADIDLDEVTDFLLKDGVDKFVTPANKLFAAIESRREAVTTGRPGSFESNLPDHLEPKLAARVKQAEEEDVARRIWRKDASLWGGGPEIDDRLGWLNIADTMREEVADLNAFREECRADGLTDVALLGMGGSSLAPEVFRQSFPTSDEGLRLHVLDSTDAGAVLSLERRLDLDKTLFIVSSKSGGTLEPNAMFRYFHERLEEKVGDSVDRHFAAVTDPGSSLQQLATEHGFRRIFVNDPNIGGRYSALSFFGLVPAALMGVDLERLLDTAGAAEEACANYDSSSSNSGLWLGLTLGELALNGVDKLTFQASEPIGSFGLWAEQLVAESTGKEGKGIVPVAGEPTGGADSYGSDRVFVHLRPREEADEAFGPETIELVEAGHAVLTVFFEGPEDLGRVFFFAEFATAVAGWVLGINPFDQPNVQEAKDATSKVLERYSSEGGLPEVPSADDTALKALLGSVEPPSYVSLHGYVEPSAEFDAAIAELRTVIRDATKATTTFGYGPRFLHSTGQLHKGGPATGVFLQLIHDGDEDVEIPDAGYSFTTLKNAQAIGDLETLRAHDLPAERLRLQGDPVEGVRELTAKIRDLLGGD